MKEEPKIVARALAKCPYCHDTISPRVEKTGCESCMAWHHLECWDSHGACSACGYKRTPSQRLANPTTLAMNTGDCDVEDCRERSLGSQEADYCAILCADHALEQLKKNRRAGNVFFMAILALLGLAINESWDGDNAVAVLGMGFGILGFATVFMVFGFQKIKSIEQHIWVIKQDKPSR
ncbi:MAG: hypothetical protein P1V97_29860 [Planctomycetota bacterium]|nr:hypothetical protein [Planctomycetota bacterium]